MTKHRHPDQPNVSIPCEARDSAKKRYLKPAFRHEKVFEAMALACGKVNNSQGSCHANRKRS